MKGKARTSDKVKRMSFSELDFRGAVQSGEKYRAPRCKDFTSQETNLLITLVGERLKARTNQNEGSLNPTAQEWDYIWSQFNYRSTEYKREKEVLKNRWKTLKSDFSFFKELASKSGNGWNEVEGIPDVTEEAWDSYIALDKKRYKPYRYKKFPWFRAMQEICGHNIATCNRQVTSDPIPILHNFDSDSVDDDQKEESSTESVEILKEYEQNLCSDNINTTSNQMPQVNNPVSPMSIPSMETEVTQTDCVKGKRKRSQSLQVEPSQKIKRNTKCKKNEVAHTFLTQQRSRNETLDKVAHNLERNPKYGSIQKEVIDRLKSVLDPRLPTFHADYYDMLVVLGNDWIRECFMNESDDMVKGYVDYSLYRYRSGLSLVHTDVFQNPSAAHAFMPSSYGAVNASSQAPQSMQGVAGNPRYMDDHTSSAPSQHF